MNNKLFILCSLVLFAIVSFVAAGGQDVTFCRSPQGVHCNYGSGEAGQEVVQTLKNEEQVAPAATAATTQGFWQQNTDINRKFDCVSSCEWIRADKYVCDDCVYEYAFYNKTNGYKGQECITQDNKWSVMKDEPQKVETYVASCQAKGICKCRKPPARCTLSCATFYDSVCPLQLTKDNAGFSGFIRKMNKENKPQNVNFLKCAKYSAAKFTDMSVKFRELGKFLNGRGISTELLAQYSKLKVKPFLFTDAAAEIKLNFDTKELNYWCPAVYESTQEFVNQFQARLKMQKKTGAKFAPKKILEAIDSYCSYKLDKAEIQFKAQLQLAQIKYAEKKAIESAKKAAKKVAKLLKKQKLRDSTRVKKIEKAAAKAAKKTHAKVSKQQRKFTKKIVSTKQFGLNKNTIKTPKRPSTSTAAQKLVAKAVEEGKKLNPKPKVTKPVAKPATKVTKAKPVTKPVVTKKQQPKVTGGSVATKKVAQQKPKPAAAPVVAKPKPKPVAAQQPKPFVMPKIAAPAPQFQAAGNKKAKKQLKKL